MRPTSACFILGVIVLVAHAHAEGSFSGSILRLDEQTYRVVIEGYISTSDPPSCPEGRTRYCCWTYFSRFSISGPFALPGNVIPPTDFVGPGGMGWFSERASVSGAQFEFAVSPTQTSPMPFECWGMREDQGECYDPSGGPRTGFLLYGEHAQTLYGVLPARVGDSAPLGPALAVESTPWTTVKRFYRE